MKAVRWWLVVAVLWLAMAPAIAAQDEELELRLSRDFGFAAGTQMEGRFSFRVSGPDTLERVEFIIDDAVIAEDTEAPWRYQFDTGSYDLGTHTMRAVGYTSDGQVLSSQAVVRQFVPARNPLIIVGVVLGIAVIGLLAATLISRRSGGYGPLGAAVCPNCGRPYGIHLWSLNLAGRRFDRCPHCGKWRLIRRATAAEVAAAEAVILGVKPSDGTGEKSLSDEEALRRRLDDSRFDDSL